MPETAALKKTGMIVFIFCAATVEEIRRSEDFDG
jgi:hypothetical protein